MAIWTDFVEPTPTFNSILETVMASSQRVATGFRSPGSGTWFAFMMGPYLMLKFGHFTGTIRSGDMVLGLLDVKEKAKFYKKFKILRHPICYNGVYISR
jgi:hypothetical protein